MLEGCRGSRAERLLELADERPRVERVEEIDVAGGAVEDLEGERRAADGVTGSGLLMRVAATEEASRAGSLGAPRPQADHERLLSEASPGFPSCWAKYDEI